MIIAIHNLRAIAAVSVVVGHIFSILNSQVGSVGYENYFKLYVGVDVFFLVSGYVMGVSAFGKPTNALFFLKNRARRILPIYWIITLIAILIVSVFDNLTTHDRSLSGEWIFGSLFLFPVQSPSGLTVPIVGVGWTLLYEAFFYLIFAISLTLFNKEKHRIGFIAFIFVFVFFSFGESSFFYLRFYSSPIIFEFLVGLAVYHYRHFFLRLFANRSMLFIPIVVLVCYWIYGEKPVGHLERVTSFLPVSFSIFWLAFAMSNSSSRVMSHFADGSYSIYVTQIFSIQFFESFVLERVSHDGVFVFITLLVTLLGGVMFHRIIERPVDNLIRRWS